MEKRYLLTLLPALGLISSLAVASAQPPAASVVSTGKEVNLTTKLQPEQPTVFVFMKSTSSLERAFLQDLQKSASEKVGLRVIQLKTGMEPITRQYEIKDTPTALVYDRRGRQVARSSDPEQIRAAIKKAAGVMRIDWAEEDTPLYEEAARALHGRKPGSGILRTMSLKPEYLGYINDLANKAHFQDGFLNRRTKEMIATYVSAINHCKY